MMKLNLFNSATSFADIYLHKMKYEGMLDNLWEIHTTDLTYKSLSRYKRAVANIKKHGCTVYRNYEGIHKISTNTLTRKKG